MKGQPMRTTLILTLLLLSFPAHAGSWLKLCRSGNTVTALSPGDWACYQPSSNSDDSVLLNVEKCENVDALYFLDRDGDGTASTVTPTVRSCPMGLASTDSDACWIVENVTFDGDPSTGNEAIYGFKAHTLYVDMPASGTIADPQMDVHCNGPSN